MVVGALGALEFEIHSSGRMRNIPVVIVPTASNEIEYNVPHADKCVAVGHR